MPLDPYAERFLSLVQAAKGAPQDGAPISQRRAALNDLAQLADAKTSDSGITSVDMTVDGPKGEIPVRIYGPAGGGRPGIIYLHGGGWTAGSLASHDGTCRALAASSGFALVAVDYRLAPEHPFPAGLLDALAVLEAVAANPARFGVEGAHLILAGDSAGATLAAALAGMSCDGHAPAIAGLLLICPILDMAAEAPSRAEFGAGYFVSRASVATDLAAYLGPTASALDPGVSPLRRASLAGMPPTIIHVAEFDPFRDEGLAYAARLQVAGCAVQCTTHQGMIHYFYALARAIPSAGQILEQIGAQLRG